MKKRLGAALLALTMLLSLCPLYALAAEEETTVRQETEVYIPDAEWMPDNDELFAGYVQTLLYPGVDLGFNTLGASGNNLDPLNKAIYDKLKTLIAEIAAGEQTDTVLTITTSELALGKSSWTIEELQKIDKDITNTVSQDNFDKAVAAAKILSGYDSSAIIDMLLVDCPYELYWFDKTKGWSQSSAGYWYTNEGNTILTITFPDTLTFTFQVAKDYAADYVDGNSTTTNLDLIGERAANAKKNAIAIVNGVDATATDFERLMAYKNEICKLVSYDYDAVKSDYKPSYGYGDPWQLIRVFDGVSEDASSGTPSGKNAKKVVCEGYSKAFQYLCDLTNSNATMGSFSGEVDCYIITGYMGGGTGAGGHMWNHVKIGGEYYLVDVTNCDDGSVGAPDNLFMVGGPKIEDKNDIIATLTYDGGRTFTYYTNYQFALSPTIRYSFDEDANKWGNEPVLTLSENAKYEESAVPAEKVTPYVAVPPTATATYGQTLKDVALTGGSVVVSENDNTTVAGTWSWADDTQSVGNVSDSTPATFNAKFAPNDQTAYNNVTDVKVAVTVNAKLLTDSMVTLTGADNLVYDGNGKTPAVTVKDGSTTLEENTDYTKSYSENVNAGAADDASVTIEGKGNYTGSVTKTFSIAPKPLANSMIELGTQQNTYTGTEQKVFITSVKDGGKDLTEGIDYIVTGGDTATNVGNTTLTITGAGNYSGTATATWTLQKATPTATDFNLPTLDATGKPYTGSAISVAAPTTGKTGMGAVTVKYGDSTTAPTDAGEYAVTFDVAEGTNYKAASGLEVGKLIINKIEYTGTKTQSVTVRSNQEATNKTLTLPALPAGASYGTASVTTGSGLITVTPDISGTTLTYSVNSKEAGTTETVTVAVTGATNYNDYSLEVTFTAQDKEDAGVTVTPASGTVKYGETVTITASNANGGTGTWSWNYSDEFFEAVGETDASSITLKAKKAGNAQTVTAIFDNADYIGSADTSITVNKAASAVAAAPTARTGLAYTGLAQELVNAGTATGGTLQYSVNDGVYAAAIPAGTNAGSYTVKYKVVGDADHEDSAEQPLTVTIAMAEPDIGTVSKSAPDTIYPHTELGEITLTKTGSTAGTLALTAGQTLTAGTKNYNWTFTPTDAANYNTKTGAVSLTVTEDKLAGIAVKADTAPTKTDYKWGEEFTLDGAVIEASYDSGAKKEISADKLTFSKALTVGQDKVTVSYTEDGVTKSCDISLTVSKADARTLTDVSVSLKYDVTAEQTASLSGAGMPSDAGTLTYTKGTETKTGGVTVSGWSVDSATGAVKYTLSGGANGDTVTLPVTVGSENYADSVVNIKIVLTDKNVPDVTAQDITRTYTGEAVPSTEITGTASFDGNPVAGVWSWKDPSAVTNVADSGVKTVVFTPGDTDTYATVEVNLTLTINKATPTGTPAYTPITTTGKTLADAALTVGTITPAGGTIAWNDGDSKAVDANTAYGWTYTPGDTANYNNLTGSITPYQRSTGGNTGSSGSSSGGGSSGGSNTSTSTTTNADGSTTTRTENKTTGTVTETTKVPDGSQTVVETKKDGTVTTTETDKDGNTTKEVQAPDGSSELTVNRKDGATATVTTDAAGRTEAEVRLPRAVVSAAQKSGEAVTLPIPGVEVRRSTDSAPVVTVKTNSGEAVKVEIPTASVTPGTVAVIVNADGSEEVIKDSIPTADGVAVSLPDGAKVKIIDNSKFFTDVSSSHWASDAVDFASARELFSGTGEATFSPESSMTRAMLMTVLARYGGEDTSGGATWYEKGMDWAVANGISDGSNPNADITREQLAVMLWRYSGSPAAYADLNRFPDAGDVSDYAQQAMRWAISNGIVNGFDNGMLGPKGRATRAQVAQMLKNFLEHQ